jgi:alpha-tubulin suppressor-like RCC1 family protein
MLACSLIALAAGCRPAERTVRQVAVAQFEGDLDLRAGTMSLHPLAGGLRLASVSNVPVSQDGVPGTGAVDTVELVTESVSVDPLVCGRANAFCANVTIRSFFATDELHNVFLEITAMTPSTGGLGFAKTAAPVAGQPGFGEVGNAYALWSYPALLDVDSSTAGFNAATRTWYFDNLSSQSYHFVGRVMADRVTAIPEAIGTLATCGAVATALDGDSNCGECGRTAPAGSTCHYTAGDLADVNGPAPALAFGVTCAAGTACDSGDSMAYACVDLQTSSTNCGVCGNDCGVGVACAAGVCSVTCEPGDTPCDTHCCPAGSTCSGSICILSDATELTVGADHSCAVTTTSRLPTLSGAPGGIATWPNNVVCWGQNHLNAFSNPVWTQGLPAPELYPDFPQYHLNTDMYAVAAGHTVSAALSHTPDISARQWGQAVGFNVVDGWHTRAVKLSIGEDHGCGQFNYLLDSTTIGPDPEGIYCWGYNSSGALGKGDAVTTDYCLTDGGNDLTCFPLSLTNKTWPLYGGGGLTSTDIASGGDTTCVVEAAPGCASGGGQCHGEGQTAGNVACWGDNTDGKAGKAVGTAYLIRPAEVTGIAGAVEVSVGHQHAVARLSGGDLVFWGSNADGQYGDASNVWEAGTLVTVAGASATSVAAGNGFTCYVAGGHVYCAGRNDHGQLGDGTTAPRNTFAQVLGVSGAVEVRAGGVPGAGGTAYGTACARTGGGNVLCWGDNQNGQLGRGVAGGSLPYSSSAALVQLANTAAIP